MAILTEQERVQIWRGLMRYASRLHEDLGTATKSDLRSGVDYTDDWIDQRVGQYSLGLPEPIRSEWTAAQKTILFCVVAAMRVSPAFARALIGEVD